MSLWNLITFSWLLTLLQTSETDILIKIKLIANIYPKKVQQTPPQGRRTDDQSSPGPWHGSYPGWQSYHSQCTTCLLSGLQKVTKEHRQTDKPKPECGRCGGRPHDNCRNVQQSIRSATIAIKLDTTTHVLQNKTLRCKHTSRWKQCPRGIWPRWDSFPRNTDCRALFRHKWLHRWNWQHPRTPRLYQSINWNAANYEANPQAHHTDSTQNRHTCRDECNLQQDYEKVVTDPDKGNLVHDSVRLPLMENTT